MKDCRLSCDWGEDFQEEEEVEEVEEEEKLRGNEDVGPLKLSAMYPYSGEEEGTLALEPGQQFLVVGEQEEQEGWVRVRRVGEEEEGYIPLAYTQPV